MNKEEQSMLGIENWPVLMADIIFWDFKYRMDMVCMNAFERSSYRIPLGMILGIAIIKSLARSICCIETNVLRKGSYDT